MMGDTAYQIYTASSWATSGAANQLLFGNYGGLSSINQSEVVLTQLQVSGLELRIGNSTTTNNVGLMVSAAASVFDLLPMRAGDASGLFAARVTSDNASYLWTIWRRVPNSV